MIDSGKVKSVLNQYELDVVAMVYNGLTYSVPKIKTLGHLKKELKWVQNELGLSSREVHFLWLETNKKYEECRKSSYLGLYKARKALGTINYSDYMEKRKEEVFLSVEKAFVSTGSTVKAVNEVYKSAELRFKTEKLSQLTDSGDIFYVCSWHSDCAKDHLEYQGRIYVDENWTNKVSDPEERAKIEAYIRNHSVMTIQEVTSGPIWLCTRPYCRHYFKSVDTVTVLSKGVKSIVQEKGMVDRKEHQMSDAERYRRAYAERLRVHTRLYRVIPCQPLAKKIKEDKELLKKWTRLASK